VAQATFEETSASDYVSLYNQGYSINELLICIYDEQKTKGGRGRHLGVFRNCKKKKQVIKILHSWYDELKGG
jgi:hypothetical protein